MRKLLLTLAVVSIAALVAVGCGKDDQAASGASELVPAGSVIYGEATLKPEGDQKEAIDAILAKFPGGGQAGDKLKDLIEKGLRESDAPISFKEDIEPWLGDEAAFFVAKLGPSGQDPRAPPGLIATDDEDKARAALEKSAEGKLTKKNYKDVEYLTDESDEVGRRVRRLPRARHRGRRQGRDRHQQGRQEAVRGRELQERARRRMPTTASGSST